MPSAPPELTVRPIGVARTPFTERAAAPRQPRAAEGTPGRIELYPGHGYEDALRDLEAWTHVWVLFWFHEAQGWRPTVQPPRSDGRRGLFATRSPHRPNPIGMSVLRLERVEGLVVHVRDVDLLDGTPVLDLKPYVAYTDAVETARGGWLAPDPEPAWTVVWTDAAREQAAYLECEHGIRLVEPVLRALALGPRPHAYRRIRKDGDGWRLAVKEWRVRFEVDESGRAARVLGIASGYRAREIATSDDPALLPHRAFSTRFGQQG